MGSYHLQTWPRVGWDCQPAPYSPPPPLSAFRDHQGACTSRWSLQRKLLAQFLYLECVCTVATCLPLQGETCKGPGEHLSKEFWNPGFQKQGLGGQRGTGYRWVCPTIPLVPMVFLPWKGEYRGESQTLKFMAKDKGPLLLGPKSSTECTEYQVNSPKRNYELKG